MKKNFLLLLLLLGCGIARAQYADRIVTNSGRTIKCTVEKIKNDTLYFQVHGPDGYIAIQGIKELYIDIQAPRKVSQAVLAESYNEAKHRLDSIAGNNALSPPAELTAIKIPPRRGDSAGYYNHALKLNLLSAIFLDLTVKYQYRFNEQYGVQAELGYIHGFGQNVEPPILTHELPFAYKGIVARASFINYFEPVKFKRNRYLSIGLFYKYQHHDKTTIYLTSEYDDKGTQLSAWRAVYGAQLTIGNQKYAGHFMFEYYLGISMRYINEKQVIYYGEQSDGLNIGYGYFSPPKHEIHHYVRPAIQLGVNLGWGFNGKKK